MSPVYREVTEAERDETYCTHLHSCQAGVFTQAAGSSLCLSLLHKLSSEGVPMSLLANLWQVKFAFV